jgi:hypothetical protein
MSKHLVTQIDIAAEPERVWQVLTELTGYEQWNPFIVRAEGTVEPGSRLTLRMQPVEGKATTQRPTVLEARRAERLRWLGRVGVPGLFDADHTFLLEPRDGGGTTLRQNEEFRGVLVPFLSRTLDRGTLPAFHAMNQALKHRAEESVRPSIG